MSFENSTVFDNWHLWSLRMRGSVKTLKQCWQIRTFLQTALKSILNGFCARSISMSIFTIFLKTKFLWIFRPKFTEKLRFIYNSQFLKPDFSKRAKFKTKKVKWYTNFRAILDTFIISWRLFCRNFVKVVWFVKWSIQKHAIWRKKDSFFQKNYLHQFHEISTSLDFDHFLFCL